MADTTPERDKAWRIHERYAEATKRIKDDKDLADEGRHRRLADEWAQARKALEGLRDAEGTQLVKRQQELERRLFGSGLGGLDAATSAISARDAQDRAERLTTPQEAASLLHRAEQNGDQALARAVAQHAARRSDDAMTPQQSQ